MFDDELSSVDISRLNAMLQEAKERYLDKGYPPRVAHEEAVQDVYEQTGYALGKRPDRAGRGGRGGNDYRYAERFEAAFAPLPGDCSFYSPPRQDRQILNHMRYSEESSRGAGRSRTGRSSSSRTQPSGTEYDRMFQDGKDSQAARTSGKVLSLEEIKMREFQIVRELINQDMNPEYARQQGEQFTIRECGKRVRAGLEAAGLPKDYNRDEENENRGGQRARRAGDGREKFAQGDEDEHRTGRSQSSDKENDEYGFSRRQASRSEYAAYGADPWERSNSNRNSEKELRAISEKIYDEWIEKGASPEEARHEAKTWFKRNKSRGTRVALAARALLAVPVLVTLDRLNRRACISTIPPQVSLRRSLDTLVAAAPAATIRRTVDLAAAVVKSVDLAATVLKSVALASLVRRDRRARQKRTLTTPLGAGLADTSYDDSKDEPSGVKPDVDLYKLLGVHKSATGEEIKAAHRKLCIKHHPDRVQGGPAAKQAATETMARINQASDVLKDREMRATYDRTGLIASVGESPDA
ncbi:hypothetical protein SVAN01_05743 [Stagonosporopsis vannaccii]|nr:hypothetical protein SVAN01_05743 [Stagonosporopsis vannaccii]